MVIVMDSKLSSRLIIFFVHLFFLIICPFGFGMQKDNDTMQLITTITEDDSRQCMATIDSDSSISTILEKEDIAKLLEQDQQISPPFDSIAEPQKEKNKIICSICSKGFCYPHLLKIHTYIHTGETPFKCIECDYSSAQECNLKRYIEAMHPSSTAINYPCSLCAMLFNTQGQRKYRQTKKHEFGKFACKKCDKICMTSYNLASHYTYKHLHIHEQKYGCEGCEKRFPKKNELTNHQNHCKLFKIIQSSSLSSKEHE